MWEEITLFSDTTSFINNRHIQLVIITNERKILFIAGAIILVVITALLTTFWYYADSSQENHDNVLANEATSMTASFSNFTSVEFEQSTFDSTQVPKIQEEVCGQVVRSHWVPEKVKFAHLEPAATIYRIPCSINPAGSLVRTSVVN